MKIVHHTILRHRELANVGCSVCPCCGETRKTFDYIREGKLNKGIIKSVRREIKGFFRLREFQIDEYMCETCGTRWGKRTIRSINPSLD